MTQQTIQFCHADDPNYGFLSNMYLAEMMVDGKPWPSAEHYYQAQKFTHVPAVYQAICNAKTGNETRELAKTHKSERRNDWDAVKEDLLLTTMKLKFTENAEMRQKLLGTGDAYLQKSVPDDPFWGVLPDGTGQNRMGQMLMGIRAELAR